MTRFTWGNLRLRWLRFSLARAHARADHADRLRAYYVEQARLCAVAQRQWRSRAASLDSRHALLDAKLRLDPIIAAAEAGQR